MAYNSETDKYDLTKWPSPLDGLPIDSPSFGINVVDFELLKPSSSKQGLRNLLESNNYNYQSSVLFDTYYHSLLAIPDSLEVFVNNTKLDPSSQYTYSPNFKRIRLLNIIPPPGEQYIGLLYCRYIPQDKNIRLGEIPKDFEKQNALFIKHIGTTYIYEFMVTAREAIQDIWYYLGKTKPTWIGGPNNRHIGYNNIIKYLTPISNNHFNEILREITSINDYIFLVFDRFISIDLPDSLEESYPLNEDLLIRISNAINELEEVIGLFLKDPILRLKLTLS